MEQKDQNKIDAVMDKRKKDLHHSHDKVKSGRYVQEGIEKEKVRTISNLTGTIVIVLIILAAWFVIAIINHKITLPF